MTPMEQELDKSQIFKTLKTCMTWEVASKIQDLQASLEVAE
jgi:hypothetical protein